MFVGRGAVLISVQRKLSTAQRIAIAVDLLELDIHAAGPGDPVGLGAHLAGEILTAARGQAVLTGITEGMQRFFRRSSSRSIHREGHHHFIVASVLCPDPDGAVAAGQLAGDIQGGGCLSVLDQVDILAALGIGHGSVRCTVQGVRLEVAGCGAQGVAHDACAAKVNVPGDVQSCIGGDIDASAVIGSVRGDGAGGDGGNRAGIEVDRAAVLIDHGVAKDSITVHGKIAVVHIDETAVGCTFVFTAGTIKDHIIQAEVAAIDGKESAAGFTARNDCSRSFTHVGELHTLFRCRQGDGVLRCDSHNIILGNSVILDGRQWPRTAQVVEHLNGGRPIGHVLGIMHSVVQRCEKVLGAAVLDFTDCRTLINREQIAALLIQISHRWNHILIKVLSVFRAHIIVSSDIAKVINCDGHGRLKWNVALGGFDLIQHKGVFRQGISSRRSKLERNRTIFLKIAVLIGYKLTFHAGNCAAIGVLQGEDATGDRF